MVGIRDKLCWGRSIGIYISGDCITVTEVGSTYTGRIVLKQYRSEFRDEEPGPALRQMLEENISHRQRQNMPVCIGLGPEQTFFMTCISNLEPNETPSLKNLLEASGAKSGLETEGTVADFFKISKLRPTGNQLWTVTASRRKFVEQLYKAVQDSGVQNVSLQPGPISLPITTKQLPRPCKTWKITVRIYFNAKGGLAILVVDGRSIVWREFAYSVEERLKIIVSVVRTLIAYAATAFGILRIDGIVLQGDKAAELVDVITDEVGYQTVAVEGEGFTDAQCSYGLALSATQSTGAATSDESRTCLDLFRTLRATPSILDMFPWKLAVIVIIMVACMGFMMWQRASELTNKYDTFVRQNASYEWTKRLKTGEISNERKQLLSEVQAVSKFISTRIVWSDYLRDLPTRLPVNACLSNIWAVNELKEMNKKKQGRRVKKSLTMQGVTKFSQGTAAPQEIEAFLESLRKVDLLKRDFPLVQLAEIKWRREGESEIAMFTVVALPKKKTGKTDDKD